MKWSPPKTVILYLLMRFGLLTFHEKVKSVTFFIILHEKSAIGTIDKGNIWIQFIGFFKNLYSSLEVRLVRPEKSDILSNSDYFSVNFSFVTFHFSLSFSLKSVTFCVKSEKWAGQLSRLNMPIVSKFSRFFRGWRTSIQNWMVE